MIAELRLEHLNTPNTAPSRPLLRIIRPLTPGHLLTLRLDISRRLEATRLRLHSICTYVFFVCFSCFSRVQFVFGLSMLVFTHHLSVHSQYFRITYSTMLTCLSFLVVIYRQIHDGVIKWKHFPRNWLMNLLDGDWRRAPWLLHVDKWCRGISSNSHS